MRKMVKSVFGIALGIGIGVGVQQVQALPGTSIGYGQNPLVSIGGSAYDGETKVLLTAPVDQDIIVKDLILTSFSNINCKRGHKSELILGSGAILGQFETSNGSYNNSDNAMSTGLSIQHAFAGGLRIPAGDTLTFVVTQTTQEGYCPTSTNYGVRYMVSGYYAQM